MQKVTFLAFLEHSMHFASQPIRQKEKDDDELLFVFIYFLIQTEWGEIRVIDCN